MTRDLVLGDVGHDLNPPVADAAGGEEAVGDALEFVAFSMKDEHIHRVVRREVDAHGGAHPVAEFRLDFAKALGEIVLLGVVDERQARDRVDAAVDVGPRQFGAHEIAENFGARRPALLDQRIELREEGRFHGDAEANNGRTHGAPHTRRTKGRRVKFVDSCKVKLIAGAGGNGCVAFRREKYIPHGGPSGGDGGRGGDVVLEVGPGLSTLLDLSWAHTLSAEEGEKGLGADCYGRGGADKVVRVPVGTQVIDEATNEILHDLTEVDSRVVVCKGGRGGRGNMHFATPYDKAPRRAEPGEPGEERTVRLELKVMADVGLLGFPNVGKSTFIRACSKARPKVADYPFTTLVPHLGVVSIGEEANFVIADIPGLIAGASEGAGLGHRFLKHVERTRALLHLITLTDEEGRDPVSDYEVLMKELKKFDPELAKRPMIVALSQSDRPEVQDLFPELKKRFAKKKIALTMVSAATGSGVRDLTIALYKLVKGELPEED